MKKIIILLFALLTGNCLFAQTDTTNVDDTTDIDREFTSVQIEASFPGGTQAWRKYLEKNLDADLGAKYIKIPKGQQEARQTVIVQFRVDKTGKISDVKALETGAHPKLMEEAVRVIKNGPDWVPAKLNGKEVIYRQRQSITWVAVK